MADDNPERCIGCEEEIKVDVHTIVYSSGEYTQADKIPTKYCSNHRCSRFGLVTFLVLNGKT